MWDIGLTKSWRRRKSVAGIDDLDMLGLQELIINHFPAMNIVKAIARGLATPVVAHVLLLDPSESSFA